MIVSFTVYLLQTRDSRNVLALYHDIHMDFNWFQILTSNLWGQNSNISNVIWCVADQIQFTMFNSVHLRTP